MPLCIFRFNLKNNEAADQNSIKDDEWKVVLGQEEVVKVEGKGRSCLEEMGTTRQHLKSLMCLKNSLLSGICA